MQKKSLDETEVKYVDTLVLLDNSIRDIQNELKNIPLLGVDLEYHNPDPTQESCMILALI